MQQHIEKHKTLLKNFINDLSLPDTQANLILLKKTYFNKNENN